jgi:ABC-2 type transport system ATP-binding protein
MMMPRTQKPGTSPPQVRAELVAAKRAESSAARAIEIEGLVKRFGPVTAVDGLDLVVERGECFGLLGPNGAGKTTTIEILVGLNRATEGNVRVLGRHWSKDRSWIRSRIGVVFQQTYLQERLSVEELLRLFRSFYRQGCDIDELLDLVSLRNERKRWFERLSGGQKQRLAIACALVGDPELLVLDEPSSGLDPQSRRRVWDIVLEMRARGRSVLLATHYMDEAERLCDRVGIVDRGRMIAVGSPRDLIAAHGGDYVIEVESDRELDTGELGAVRGVLAVHGTATAYHLATHSVSGCLPHVLSYMRSKGAPLKALSTRGSTLEDVYIAITGNRLHTS